MSKVEVIALGGVGEIGKNCTVIRQDDDIIVVDCGLAFPNEEMPGIDIVIPDFTYLIENKDKIRGIFLTHAHEDHVGSLPYLLREINVPVYGSDFTMAMIHSKLDEKVGLKGLMLRNFAHGDVIEAGSMSVEPIRVTHSIPENSSFAIRTKHGIILMTGDFKFDFSPVDGKLSNITRFGQLGEEGVVLLLSDSTNVDRPGWGPSESIVSEGLRKVFEKAEGRVLLTTFASNIHRMQQVFEVAAETGRKVAAVGRRMENNLDTCSKLGYINIPKGTRIKLDQIRDYPADQLAILTTGSQGEPLSALVQMSKQEYGRLRIMEGDTIIYSARPIPGNEAAIWRTVNRLFRLGAKVVYDTYPAPVHVSGHAYQEELKMMINLTRPFYLAPVHGEPRHQHLYLQIAKDMGHPEHRLFTMVDGVPLVLSDNDAFLDERVACGRVLVDCSGTPGVSDDILRDRHNLSREGLITVTIAVDPEAGEVVGDPLVQARGFHGPEGALDSASDLVWDALSALNKSDLKNVDKLRHDIADLLRKFIQKQTGMRPLIVPNVIEV
ncbi:MAG: ribonuclease J [Fimbriimonadaceae bacterium]|nr:ribonuclease J [Fimbriimonadaceae bacterium]